MVTGLKKSRWVWILLAFLVLISASMVSGSYNRAETYIPKVDSEIQKAVANLETIAALMEEMKNSGIPDRDTLNSILKAVLRKNPNYLATWTCWEPNALDNLDYQFINNIGHDETGRFIPYWNRLEGSIDVAPLAGYAKNGSANVNRVAFRSGETTVSEPIEYRPNNESLYKIVITAPIYFDDQVAGIVGIDIPVQNT